jgi:hypothetical protein
MNMGSLARQYDKLTPEERFRLILAAGLRGDKAEQGRLASAGKRITLSMPDHAPFAHAFSELTILAFLELLDEAAGYLESFYRGDDDTTIAERFFHLSLASGFMLRTKTDGWKLFCERLNIPPFALWEGLPGLDRFKRALALTENEPAAFGPYEFLAWMNERRPDGKPELTELPFTAESLADADADAFRKRSEWWGGEAAA